MTHSLAVRQCLGEEDRGRGRAVRVAAGPIASPMAVGVAMAVAVRTRAAGVVVVLVKEHDADQVDEEAAHADGQQVLRPDLRRVHQPPHRRPQGRPH